MSEIVISNVVKVYPNMIQVVIYHNSYKLSNKLPSQPRKLTKSERNQINIDRSVRRTRTFITDIAICNSWDLWVTFTFDKLKVDRYNVQRCKSKMSLWLHRQKMHSPNMQYLIVPEFHKRCEECSNFKKDSCPHDDAPKALHFHALVSNYNGNLKDSGHKTKRGQTVYKMTGYRSGFTEAVRLTKNDGDDIAIAHYIAKYITKDTISIFAQKRYWCSQGLTRPQSHTNGLAKFNLWHVVKKTKPLFINNELEMFHIPYSGIFQNTKKQTQIIDVDDFTTELEPSQFADSPLLNHYHYDT